MGGLSKKAFQFEKIIGQENLPAIIVDAGSLFFKRTKLSDKLVEQEKVTAFGIVESYSRIGYDAVGIAREDLIAGLDFFRQLSDASSFPWLSANLVDINTNKPLFNPSVIIQKGNISIGITGLTAADLYVKFKAEDNAAILPWQEVLPGIATELEKKCDIVILLSNLSAKDNLAITELYPDIDIIIQAGVNSANKAPQLLNRTLICQTGNQGKQIGIMNINWQNAPWGSEKPAQLDKTKKSLDRLLWQLSKFDKYKDPLTELKKNPDQLRIYQNLISRKKELEGEIETLTTEIARQEPTSETPSTFKNRFIAMQTSLPDHPDVFEIVEKMNEKINQIGKKQINSKKTVVSDYMGSENCAPCHNYQAESWLKSMHAKAYATLVNKEQQFNLDCLPCHVTGNGELDQGDAVNLSKGMQAVGCENCHGPGRQHSKAPEKNPLSAQLAASTCLKCHTDDHDDSFEFDRDVQKLNCVPELN